MAYLAAMTQLELDYPTVHFVYMTGHLDGTGPSGNLYRSNNQIRACCQAEDKLLFDFADIESWDPAGAYYPEDTDACLWCVDWCSANPCPDCGDCAHSPCSMPASWGRASTVSTGTAAMRPAVPLAPGSTCADCGRRAARNR